jgi:hypothetical protein
MKKNLNLNMTKEKNRNHSVLALFSRDVDESGASKELCLLWGGLNPLTALPSQ